MTARLHRASWFFAGLCAGSMFLTPLAARQSAPAVPARAGEVSGPKLPVPVLQSPIQIFRNLLAKKPEERELALAQFPAERRPALLAKVLEYEAMKPGDREDRLRTTELRWYLLLFMNSPATNRAAQLASVPEANRLLVADRLQQWDLLPPTQQKQVLEYEITLQYFVPQDGSRTAVALATNGAARQPEELGRSVDRWNSLPPAQREEMQARFEKFFRLTPGERQEALPDLTGPERMKMARSLQDFSRLPAARREQCLRAFAKFASLSRAERDEFLKNAEHWKELPAAERQAWQNLVQRVPPMPPLPGSGPPLPQIHPRPKLPPSGPQVTTNTDQQPP